jgi:hypothetical protein
MLLHLTSHRHESLQLMAGHDDAPAQSMSHGWSSPQVIAPHDDPPEHAITHG